jgi:2-oxoglutarate dehydrogenase E1 component
MNVFSRVYIDSLFQDFQQDPSSLPPEWQTYFQTFDPSIETIDPNTLPNCEVMPIPVEGSTANSGVAQLQDRVDQLIRGFRVRGHLEANIDPLAQRRETNSELSPESYGLLPSDFNKTISARTIDGRNTRTLEEVIDLMRQTYCRSIGAQFMRRPQCALLVAATNGRLAKPDALASRYPDSNSYAADRCRDL